MATGLAAPAFAASRAACPGATAHTWGISTGTAVAAGTPTAVSVPRGCTIRFDVIGGAGGDAFGGAGAKVSGSMWIAGTGFETLTLVVGGGGGGFYASAQAPAVAGGLGYGNGGSTPASVGFTPPTAYPGAGIATGSRGAGGGGSAILTGATPLVVAGGGGGGIGGRAFQGLGVSGTPAFGTVPDYHTGADAGPSSATQASTQYVITCTDTSPSSATPNTATITGSATIGGAGNANGATGGAAGTASISAASPNPGKPWIVQAQVGVAGQAHGLGGNGGGNGADGVKILAGTIPPNNSGAPESMPGGGGGGGYAGGASGSQGYVLFDNGPEGFFNYDASMLTTATGGGAGSNWVASTAAILVNGITYGIGSRNAQTGGIAGVNGSITLYY